MKRRFLFCLLFFILNAHLLADDDFYGKIELNMTIIDENATPMVIIKCTNKFNSTVLIPEVFLKSNYMFSSYFRFEPLYNKNLNCLPEYTGNLCILSEKDYKKCIKLKPKKSVSVSYNLCDFYNFPEDMLSSVMIQYEGPLGVCKKRIMHFESMNNSYDFDINLTINSEENMLVAELTYIYKDNITKLFNKDYFMSDENIPGDIFDIFINGEKMIFNGSFYDYYGLPSQMKNLRRCSKGEFIQTKVTLNNYYNIPQLSEINEIKVRYKGYLGTAEFSN